MDHESMEIESQQVHHLCIFCLRSCESEQTLKKLGDKNYTNDLEIALKSLQRYVRSSKLNLWLLNGNDNEDLLFGSCQDCSSLLEEFCQFYKELQLIKMKTNWKLDTLCAIIRSTEKVPQRIEALKGDSRFEKLQCFRNELVLKASIRSNLAMPEVKLKRCKRPERKTKSSQQISKCDLLKNLKLENSTFEIPLSLDPIMDISEPFVHKQESTGSEEPHEPDAFVPMPQTSNFGEASDETDLTELFPVTETVPSPVPSKSSHERDEDYNSNCDGTIKMETIHHENVEEKDDLPLKSNVPGIRRSKRKCVESSLTNFTKPEEGQAIHEDNTSDEEKPENILIEIKRHKPNQRNLSKQTALRKCPTCKKQVKASTFDIHARFHITNSNFIDDIPISPSARKLFGPPLPCEIANCKKFYYKQDELNIHQKHHGEFKCKYCEEVLDYASELPLHEMTHVLQPEQNPNSKKLYSCSRCTFTSTRNSLLCHFLENHLNLPVDYHTCPICHISIYIRMTTKNFRKCLRSHLNTSHDIAKTIYNCKESGCEAYFNARSQLRVHHNNHNYIVKFGEDGKRELECKLCARSFTSRRVFQRHFQKFCKKKHGICDIEEDEEKKDKLKQAFICEQCGKSFKSQLTLNWHVYSIHSNQKQRKTYICETCGKSFKDNICLEWHTLSHSGPESWKFSCSDCGKRCLTKQKLEEHCRTHSKEKPFNCEYCGTSYAHRHNLRNHINSKHSDIASDPARKFDKSRLVSRKGIKLKKPEADKSVSSGRRREFLKRRGRPRKKKAFSSSSSSDSDNDKST